MSSNLVYQNSGMNRLVSDTYTDLINYTQVFGSSTSLSIGTSAVVGPWWGWFQIDLTNLDPNAIINSAILTVNVKTAAAGATSLKIVSPIADLDYNLDNLSLETFDGVHPWPLYNKVDFLDYSLYLDDAMPTSTGSHSFVDLKLLVERALRTESKQLIIVIYQDGAGTDFFEIDSSESPTVTARPKITINVSSHFYPKVTRNGYETVNMPKKRTIERPWLHKLFSSKGDIIVSGADSGPARLAAGGYASSLTPDNGEIQGIKWLDRLIDKDFSQVDINNTTSTTTVYTVTVPADLLSTNRGIHIVLAGTYLNNSGGNAQLSARLEFGSTAVYNAGSQNLSSLNVVQGWLWETWMFNDDDDSLQVIFGHFNMGNDQVAAGVGYGPFRAPDLGLGFNGTAAEDTTGDLDLLFRFAHSVADANLTLSKLYGFAEFI